MAETISETRQSGMFCAACSAILKNIDPKTLFALMTTDNRKATTRPISFRRETHTDYVPLIVAYDISEDRRRNRLHRLLRGFGEPVQKSVFLCWVDHARRRRLEHLLEDFMRVPHKGKERIDCMVTRGMTLPKQEAWICE